MRSFKVLGVFLAIFCGVALALDVKIVASVDNEVITSYDVDSRIALMKKLGELPKDAPENVGIRSSVTERLINDTLLLKYGEAAGFFIPEAELDSTIKDFVSSMGLKVADVRAFLGKDAYKSAQLQIKAEIILSSLMHNHPGKNFTISENEVRSIIAEHSGERRMSEAEARGLLTNIKLGEVRANIMKGLSERSFVERR